MKQISTHFDGVYLCSPMEFEKVFDHFRYLREQISSFLHVLEIIKYSIQLGSHLCVNITESAPKLGFYQFLEMFTHKWLPIWM